jgi:probable rRNA maturation factor
MNTLIQFFSEEVAFSLADDRQIHDWILGVIHEENQQAGVINIIFCNDEYLLDLNQRFLDRELLTDVIAFDYRDESNEVSGDVFISTERIQENAENLKQSFDVELRRVIIHGILHLCGYADKSSEDKALMTLKEDKYLSLLSL